MTLTAEDMELDLVRALEDHETQGLGIATPDGRWFHANRAARRMFGASEDDLRKVGRAGVANENDPAWTSFMDQRRRTGTATGVVPMSRLDGTPLLCDLSSTAYRSDDGEDRLWLTLRDVTAAVRVQRRDAADQEITLALLAATDPAEILDLVGRHASHIFDGDFAGVVIPALEGAGPRIAATHGTAVSELLGRIVRPGSLFENVMNSRLPVRSDDLSIVTGVPAGDEVNVGPAMVVPIASDGETVGALFVGSLARRLPYGREDLQAAADYGKRIGDALNLARVRSETEQQHRLNAEQLQRALDTRVVIEQAKGFVASHLGLTPPEAFDRIRKYARSHNTKIQLVAQEIIDRRLVP
jgi:PAS domain S-box-containing protein